MPLFPPASVGEDSAQFRLSYEDKTIRAETDGGYEYRRARHNRKARRLITTGFTNITEAQKIQLEAFYESNDMYVIFTYVIPDTGENVLVRFDEPIQFEYIGYGNNHRYNVKSVKMKEV